MSVAAPAIDHLSHSQVRCFVECPRQWHYRYREHALAERVAPALVGGIAIHDTLAAVNVAALHGDSVDAAAVFATSWQATITRSTLPVAWSDPADAQEAHDRLQGLVTAYQPPERIRGIEEPFTVLIADDLPPVTGRIDLLYAREDGALVLADLKSSGTRQLSETDAVEAQLGLYDLVYPAEHHEAIVLAKLKTPVITIQPIRPWPEQRLVQHYREVYHGMTSGVRFAHRTRMCNTCAFRDRCRADG